MGCWATGENSIFYHAGTAPARDRKECTCRGHAYNPSFGLARSGVRVSAGNCGAMTMGALDRDAYLSAPVGLQLDV